MMFACLFAQTRAISLVQARARACVYVCVYEEHKFTAKGMPVWNICT